MQKYAIKKIKIADGNKMEITFYKLNPKLPEGEPLAEFTMKTDRIPSDNLRNSMLDLRDEVLKLCEINPYNENILIVKELRFSEDEEKGLSTVIVAEMRLTHHVDCIKIQTPRLYEDSNIEKEQMPSNLFVLIDEVILECYSFIDQEKKQYELFETAA